MQRSIKLHIRNVGRILLTLALLEDEKYHQQIFVECIHCFQQNYNDNFNILVFKSSKELFSSNMEIDILFLDIGLKENNDGIEIGKQMRAKGSKAVFIIISSFKNKHRDAINAGILRYLEKPYTQNEFNDALLFAIKSLQTQRYVIKVSFNGERHFIRILDILFIENYEKSRIIHFVDGNTLKTKSTWDEIINQLPPNMFCFAQRSFLINFHRVSSCTSNSVKMASGQIINISRMSKSDFAKAYQKYLEVQTWEMQYLI